METTLETIPLGKLLHYVHKNELLGMLGDDARKAIEFFRTFADGCHHGKEEDCLFPKLQERGIFANPVVSPAVPKGRSMMRTSYMATHTMEHMEIALEAFAAVGREMGIIR